ncbi:MAG TPA: VOC family protein [bacterium]|nr:VOC family protein [bacterium]
MNGLCYWDIPSTNVTKSCAFYAKLFGWKMAQYGKDYATFQAKSGLDGGIHKVKKPGQGVMVFVEVKNIPATLAKAARLGAKVLKPRTKLDNNWGYWGLFRDPGGCTSVGLWSRR